jgi:hypothetical protein
MLADDYKRDYTVAADWHGNTVITPTVKFVLTLKASMNGMKLSTLDDKSIKPEDISSDDRMILGKFVRELPRFYVGSAEHSKIAGIVKENTLAKE